ncbi:MAG: 3'(2'),5'-bisphosphate nucleotidase CysQ [Pseudomonadota bacterium]
MTHPVATQALAKALTPAVYEAGRVIMEIRQAGVAVARKDDASPVTKADHAAEAILVAAVREATPGVPIIAEEQAAMGGLPAQTGAAFWLIDPLDGTKEFINGGSDFTVNVGLVVDRQPVLGLVYAPAQKRLFVGVAGTTAYQRADKGPLLPLRTRVADASALDVVASKSHRDAETDAFLDRLRVRGFKAAGSSLKFCLIAAGEADVYPRFGPTMEWDTAAGHAVLAAAGGQVLHPDGRPFHYAKPDFRNGPFIALGDEALGARLGRGSSFCRD